MTISKTQVNNFSSIRLQNLIDVFNITEVDDLDFPKIDEEIEINSLITQQLKIFQKNIENWNETELTIKLISLILASVNYDTDKYSGFAERTITATVDSIQLSGVVDYMVASGRYEPKEPYFFIQEFKKSRNPTGDPLAQLLAEMLVAQVVNKRDLVYGTYIVGRFWYFVTMKGRKFTQILPLDSTNIEDLAEILQYLFGVKNYINNFAV